MFYRSELKTNAKRLLAKNYWWIVLVTLIFSFISGEGFSYGFNANYSNAFSSGFNAGYNNAANSGNSSFNGNYDSAFDDIDDILEGDSDNGTQAFDYGRTNIENAFGRLVAGTFGTVSLWILLITLIITICAAVLDIFILEPLNVGCRRWFLKNRTQKPSMGEVVHIFGNGYLNTAKVMFLKNLFTFLWTLLFIIPGIVKSYEYRMIPFLLAENPDMNYKEAFERSKALMNGRKWDTFVLDLSFIGWILLTSLTCGLLGIFYVLPYIELTNTELYVCLCQGRDNYLRSSNV